MAEPPEPPLHDPSLGPLRPRLRVGMRCRLNRPNDVDHGRPFQITRLRNVKDAARVALAGGRSALIRVATIVPVTSALRGGIKIVTYGPEGKRDVPLAWCEGIDDFPFTREQLDRLAQLAYGSRPQLEIDRFHEECQAAATALISPPVSRSLRGLLVSVKKRAAALSDLLPELVQQDVDLR